MSEVPLYRLSRCSSQAGHAPFEGTPFKTGVHLIAATPGPVRLARQTRGRHTPRRSCSMVTALESISLQFRVLSRTRLSI